MTKETNITKEQYIELMDKLTENLDMYVCYSVHESVKICLGDISFVIDKCKYDISIDFRYYGNVPSISCSLKCCPIDMRSSHIRKDISEVLDFLLSHKDVPKDFKTFLIMNLDLWT